jgi:hypothetical protein
MPLTFTISKMTDLLISKRNATLTRRFILNNQNNKAVTMKNDVF